MWYLFLFVDDVCQLCVGTQGYGMASALVGGVLMVARGFDGFTDAIAAAIFVEISTKTW